MKGWVFVAAALLPAALLPDCGGVNIASLQTRQSELNAVLTN